MKEVRKNDRKNKRMTVTYCVSIPACVHVLGSEKVCVCGERKREKKKKKKSCVILGKCLTFNKKAKRKLITLKLRPP